MFDKIKNIKLENISVERKRINEENTQLIKQQEKIEEELKLLRDEYESIKHSNFFEMVF